MKLRISYLLLFVFFLSFRAFGQQPIANEYTVQIEAKDGAGTPVPATLTITSEKTGLSQKGSLKNGAYTVALKTGSSYEIEANHEAYRTVRKKIKLDPVANAQPQLNVVLEMTPRQPVKAAASTIVIRVIDQVTGRPLAEGFDIRMENLTRNQALAPIDADNGSITFQIEPLQQFRFVVKAKGYETYRYESEARMKNDIMIPLKRSASTAAPAAVAQAPATPTETVTKPAPQPVAVKAPPIAPAKTELPTLERGSAITLDNVYFDQSSYLLRSDSYTQLDQLVSQLKSRPTLRIEIAGHTDNVGDNRLNQALSQNRARVIRNYLVNRGVDEKRVQYRGYGSSQPVAPSDTEENKKKNRRVVVQVLSE
ncbi:OmpA family protein [Tellurirhabdus bombi]|uniref:OmpA family protein n=1 Tax=Tellurirhabdus bombi TaxID=2907205 RepID=UPI001F35E259|nr:OmpA family protein [Tellurirhabdus bombi]